MSDIYNSLYRDLEPGKYSDGAPNPIKLAMGLAWETYFERCLIGSGVDASRPGEFTTDEGIIGSPDLLIFNGHEKIGEIKLTYYSASTDLSDPKFGKWLTQVMGYGHYLQIPRVRFYVLFVNGAYREGKRDPVLRVYDIEFSNRELKENWDMLMNHARQKNLI